MKNAEKLIIKLKDATLIAADTLNTIVLEKNKISFDDAYSLRMYCEEYIKSGGCNFGNIINNEENLYGYTRKAILYDTRKMGFNFFICIYI